MLFKYDEDKYVNIDHIVKVLIDAENTVRISTLDRDDTFPIKAHFDTKEKARDFVKKLIQSYV